MLPALPGGFAGRPGAAASPDEVETTLFRALAVLRAVVLVYAVVLNAVRWREFEHPVAGWAVVAGLVAWSAFATWAYDDPRRRRAALVLADVAVAAAAILTTPYVHSDEMLARHAATMPSFWVMTAVLAAAVRYGWAGGLLAALVVTVADLSVRVEAVGTTWGNIFLLLLAATVVGFSTALLREATRARLEAERLAATVQERARLARAAHDGVLQVLALVQRRGLELGGEAAELARLAGQQELALRALVQGDAAARGVGAGEQADLAERLAGLASGSVTVSGPGVPVPLPAAVVAELAGAVGACLDNVARHVGEDAPAWVLVEDLGDRVVVTVRDEGPGIAPGRLEEARAQGRIGVDGSIRGRLRDLGGRAVLVTGPGRGTEWELSVPR